MFLFLYFILQVSGFKHYICTNQPNHPNVKNLIESAMNDSITILSPSDSRWNNWMKLKLLHDELYKLDLNETIMLTDAHDIIMIDNHKSIIDKFNEISSRYDNLGILISSEKGVWPGSYKYPDYNKQQIFPHINSGGIIGYVWAFKQIYDNNYYNTQYHNGYHTHIDDQHYWSTWYIKSLTDMSMPRIILDHQNEIFLCMHEVKDSDVLFNGTIIKHINTIGYPKFIHFNGDKSRYPYYFKNLKMSN